MSHQRHPTEQPWRRMKTAGAHAKKLSATALSQQSPRRLIRMRDEGGFVDIDGRGHGSRYDPDRARRGQADVHRAVGGDLAEGVSSARGRRYVCCWCSAFCGIGTLLGENSRSWFLVNTVASQIAWGPKILVVCCPRQENTPRGYAPAPSPATVPRRHQDSARGTRQNRQNPDRERIEIATVALPGVEG